MFQQGEVSFYGIKKIKVFAREIVAASGSTLGVFTPNWKQTFSRPVATETNGDGTKGEDGKHGPYGPKGRWETFFKFLTGFPYTQQVSL